MSELEKKAEIVTLEKKLDAQYVQDLRALDKAGLEFKLLQLANHKEEIVTTKKRDEELKDAQELVKTLSAPYKEQLGDNKTKCRFIHLLLKEAREIL